MEELGAMHAQREDHFDVGRLAGAGDERHVGLAAQPSAKVAQAHLGEPCLHVGKEARDGYKGNVTQRQQPGRARRWWCGCQQQRTGGGKGRLCAGDTVANVTHVFTALLGGERGGRHEVHPHVGQRFGHMLKGQRVILPTQHHALLAGLDAHPFGGGFILRAPIDQPVDERKPRLGGAAHKDARGVQPFNLGNEARGKLGCTALCGSHSHALLRGQLGGIGGWKAQIAALQRAA